MKCESCNIEIGDDPHFPFCPACIAKAEVRHDADGREYLAKPEGEDWDFWAACYRDMEQQAREAIAWLGDTWLRDKFSESIPDDAWDDNTMPDVVDFVAEKFVKWCEAEVAKAREAKKQ